jgi:hypothetical protein
VGKIMKKSGTDPDAFTFLADKARESGAADIRIIPAQGIIVDDRQHRTPTGLQSCSLAKNIPRFPA